MWKTKNKLVRSQLLAFSGAPTGAPDFLVVGPKEYKLQFQVKGQEYFLAFVEDERRWYLFTQTEHGLQRMPVYADLPKHDRRGADHAIPKLSS